ncbi:hypothetical protein CYMTET_27011 [Cymbomonas tetramitiformis]|uniref:Uncharacterized protein n=1 Tax=Cymbomonas tetramitiformis TaxID=36881 RepID=A0AAE0FR40_9CHLO|nr:hypothetical protein CYMTET_27011 [Cymbomonas tetramitiformis]
MHFTIEPAFYHRREVKLRTLFKSRYLEHSGSCNVINALKDADPDEASFEVAVETAGSRKLVKDPAGGPHGAAEGFSTEREDRERTNRYAGSLLQLLKKKRRIRNMYLQLFKFAVLFIFYLFVLGLQYAEHESELLVSAAKMATFPSPSKGIFFMDWLKLQVEKGGCAGRRVQRADAALGGGGRADVRRWGGGEGRMRRWDVWQSDAAWEVKGGCGAEVANGGVRRWEMVKADAGR